MVSTGITVPEYWQDACKHLGKKDRVMKRLIAQFPDVSLSSRGDAFTTLARSIVGQQISVKAAQTVWDRFALLPKKMVPAQVLKLKIDDMRAAGLSARTDTDDPAGSFQGPHPFQCGRAIYTALGCDVLC